MCPIKSWEMQEIMGPQDTGEANQAQANAREPEETRTDEHGRLDVSDPPSSKQSMLEHEKWGVCTTRTIPCEKRRRAPCIRRSKNVVLGICQWQDITCNIEFHSFE